MTVPVVVRWSIALTLTMQVVIGPVKFPNPLPLPAPPTPPTPPIKLPAPPTPPGLRPPSPVDIGGVVIGPASNPTGPVAALLTTTINVVAMVPDSEQGKQALNQTLRPGIQEQVDTGLRNRWLAIAPQYTRVQQVTNNFVKGLVDLTKMTNEELSKTTIDDFTSATAGNVFATPMELGALGLTAIKYAELLAQKKDPKLLLSFPVASALRAGREKHISGAKELPKEVRSFLAASKVFPQSTLQRARYNIGKVEISLPNLITTGQKAFGTDYAVAVDDVIVFESEPGVTSDVHRYWWAHEVGHLRQYELWGVDEFAYRYLDAQAVEADANRYADAVMKANGSASSPNSARHLLEAVARASVIKPDAGIACTMSGQPRRRVAVSYWHQPGLVPCTVDYYKDRSLRAKEVLFHADNQVGFCERQALLFLQKLRKLGWVCE